MSYTLAGTLDSIAEQKVQHHHFLRDSTSFPQPGSIEANLQLITELIFCICPGRVYPGVSIRLVPRHRGTKDICFILFHDVSNYWKYVVQRIKAECWLVHRSGSNKADSLLTGAMWPPQVSHNLAL